MEGKEIEMTNDKRGKLVRDDSGERKDWRGYKRGWKPPKALFLAVDPIGVPWSYGRTRDEVKQGDWNGYRIVRYVLRSEAVEAIERRADRRAARIVREQVGCDGVLQDELLTKILTRRPKGGRKKVKKDEIPMNPPGVFLGDEYYS